MPLEEEMRHELRKLEREIIILDDELEKLHVRILHLIAIRKKKEHDLRILRQNFGEEEDREIQTTLAKLLKEKV